MNGLTKHRDVGTILWLVLGGFVFLLGWLVGVAQLWRSKGWTLGEKLLGTFVIPGGLAMSFLLFAPLAGSGVQRGGVCYRGHCHTILITHGPSVIGQVAAIILFVAPICTGIYLFRHWRPAQSQGTGIPAADLRSA